MDSSMKADFFDASEQNPVYFPDTYLNTDFDGQEPLLSKKNTEFEDFDLHNNEEDLLLSESSSGATKFSNSFGA